MSNRRGESWKCDEDIALCKAVISIGEDGDTATGQAKSKLWDRIAAMYMTLKPDYGLERLGGSCESRWRRIRPACTKWRESLTKAQAAFSSGQNATDLELQAKSIYCSLNKGVEFKFAHCWTILHDTMKFCGPINLEENYSGPSAIALDEDDTNESPTQSSSRARPVGQKAQKLAKKVKSFENTEMLISEMRTMNETYKLELEQSKHLAEINRQRAERLEDDNVMSKNPNDYPEPIKSYWQSKQMAIIEKMRSKGSSSTSRDNEEGYTPTSDWML